MLRENSRHTFPPQRWPSFRVVEPGQFFPPLLRDRQYLSSQTVTRKRERIGGCRDQRHDESGRPEDPYLIDVFGSIERDLLISI